MILAGDEELAAMLSSADAKGSFNSAVQAVATKRLERLNKRQDSDDYVPRMDFAREHLRAGDQEPALECLKLACEERNVHSLMIGSDPLFDPLRTDLRFVRLLERMKLSC